jgi:hypothetical protein
MSSPAPSHELLFSRRPSSECTVPILAVPTAAEPRSANNASAMLEKKYPASGPHLAGYGVDTKLLTGAHSESLLPDCLHQG